MVTRLPIPGSDDNTWGDILNTFIEVSHNSDGTLQTSAVTNALPSPIPASKLGGGTASSATFLRGDSTWAAPTGNVSSVFSRTGAVTAQNGDYTFAQVGAAQGLSPTTVKTAAYTPSPGDFVPVDASGGSVTVTLPASPADKSRVEVKLVNTIGGNKVTVNTGGADVYNTSGGSTSVVLSLLNQTLLIQYAALPGIWYVQSDDFIPYEPQPADNYLLGWTGPPEFYFSNNAPTAGEVCLERVLITGSGVISTLYFFVTSAGSGMTASENFVGIYDVQGNRIAVSSDCSATWTQTHVAKITLTAGLAVTKGSAIYVAMVFNGTTMPQLAGGGEGYWDLPNVGNGVANWASASGPYNTLAPNRFRYMSWSSGVTNLPSTVDLDFANPDKAFWVGVG